MSAAVARRPHWLDAITAAAAIAALAAGLLGYRTLRRTQPTVVALEPSIIRPSTATRVRLRGHDLRPFVQVLVVKAGTPLVLRDLSSGYQAATFFLMNAQQAEIETPALAAGVYDLYLYDQGQRISELGSALRVEPEARTPLMLAARVRFIVPAEMISLIRIGDRDSRSSAEVRELVARPGLAETVNFQHVDRNMFAGPSSVGRMLDARLAVPAVRDETGVWTSRGQPVRAGEDFAFETGRYVLTGLTLDVEAPR